VGLSDVCSARCRVEVPPVGVVADSLRRSRIPGRRGVFLAPDEAGGGPAPRAVSQEKPLRYKGMSSLSPLNGYSGPRAACREGVGACGADETCLLRRGGL